MTLSCPRKILALGAAAAFLLGGGSFAQEPKPSAPEPQPQTGPPTTIPNVPATSTPAQSPSAAPQQAPIPQQAPPPAEPNPTGQKQAPGTIRVNSTLVVLPVTVKDRDGNLVADLKKDEFRIFEDNVEQQIFSFSAEAVPLSMVVLIDNDMRDKDADQVEPSLRAIIGGMATTDEAFICRFDQFFHEGHGFTKDQDKLLTELNRTAKNLQAKSSAPAPGDPFNGPTINNAPAPGVNPINVDPTIRMTKAQPTKALDDAVYEAAMRLKDRDQNKRRKVILLISDGENGAKFNTHKYEEVKAELLRQGITVYSVAVGSSYLERKFNRLVSYAHDTGGDIDYGVRANAFEDMYARIEEQARNQYTLTFAPQGDRKVDYHSIEVRVRREGLKILTRQGYYGGTFATAPPR
jgi:VWFA-related protein